MGQNLIKHPDHIRRAQRLSLFCKEVKRAVFNLCMDYGVPLKNIDYFIEDFYISMEYHDLEYPVEVLLSMLLDEAFIVQAFDRYREKA